MNIVSKRKIIIEYWVWEPFLKQCREDEDRILAMKHSNSLLPHCGYVKVNFEKDNQDNG